MSEAALTLLKVGLVVLSLVLAAAAVSAFAVGQQFTGALLLLVTGLVAFAFLQLG